MVGLSTAAHTSMSARTSGSSSVSEGEWVVPGNQCARIQRRCAYPPARDPTQRFWVVKAKGDPSFYNKCDSSYGIVAENALLPIGGAGVVDLVAAERETADFC